MDGFKYFKFTWISILAILGVPCPSLPIGFGTARADQERIELNGGHTILGDVLAEKKTALYIDLGFDVIRIPLDEIVRRSAPDDPLIGQSDGVLTGRRNPPDRFFRSALLEEKPVNELVRSFGEAVISIETPSGLGSGFIINDDGFAVTNHHVIEGETRIAAILYERTSSGWRRRKIDDVAIIAVNPFLDLALVKLPIPEDLAVEPVVLGQVDDLDAGDGAFAVGNPLGLERSVSQGILSTLKRNFDGLVYLQTDAAINPGNSGGPLFNLRGEVIGVTNMKASEGDNLGFAIPINYVTDFLMNRDAFAYDRENPNSGYRYLDSPRRLKAGDPAVTSPNLEERAESEDAASE